MAEVLIVLAIVASIVVVLFGGSRLIGRRFNQDRPTSAPFVDTPEAWEARSVVPGESREEARARLAKFRRLGG